MRIKEYGSAVHPATVNTYVAALNSFLGFAHRVGFTRPNAASLIKLKKAPRDIAQRILGEVDVAMLIRAAKTDRDRLPLSTAGPPPRWYRRRSGMPTLKPPACTRTPGQARPGESRGGYLK
jgi:hypothetical protein